MKCLICPSLQVIGSKGWRIGESICLPPMWPRFKSRRRRHMRVEFVVGSLLCFERFFSGYCGFPLSFETNISKFQFDQESGRQKTTLWMCYLQIIIYLCIYCKRYNLLKEWGGGVIDSPLKVFLSFFLEGKTLATYVFSSCSFIPSAHFESGLVMDSFYDYEIWHHK